ncbi:MAG: hypothetical protein JSR85_08975 [Proteobacteria bacterium]|nr:hypothetical protein [Pseudomonadota bacterium]
MVKIERKMSSAGESQKQAENATSSKFDNAKPQAESVKKQSNAGRISPQLSCTIATEDKKLLNELTLFASNREGKVLNTSMLIRALIKLGHKYKDELEFM